MANTEGRTVKIPHKYDIEIMSLVADGLTLTKIVVHMLSKHKLVVNLNTLNNRVKSLKKQNTAVAHAALAQQVIQSTLNHTAEFESDINKLKIAIDKCFDTDEMTVAATLLNTKLRIQQQHLSLLGLDKTVEDDDDILKKLAGK